jgi:hypothetical protein
MTYRVISSTAALVAALLLAAPAPAKAQYFVQPYGSGGAFITHPGSGITGGYGQPVDHGFQLYVPNYQPAPAFQPNPGMQNWQRFKPGWQP